MDDAEIIELFFARDERAIAETDRKYGRLCFRIAENLLHSKNDSDECVNDTYLAVWNRILPVRPYNFTAFICRITRNLSLKKLDALHAKKRSADQTVSISELGETIPDDRFAPGIGDEEAGRLISVFLRGEKELNRNVFIRRYWFFDSIRSIAEMYSLSENNVKSMLFRTRSRLRDYLKKEGFDL